AVGPLRRRYRLADSVSRRQVVVFISGMLLIFLALASPLDELGDEYLFSAHMLQHLVLTMIGPPMLLLGTPGWLIEPLLRRRAVLRIGKVLTYPAVAFLLFNVNFWLWHAPSLYNATLSDENVHILEHLLFLITATIYWWPVFSPVEEGLPRLSLGGQILYIFLGGMPAVALGAGLTFLPPLYAPYIQQSVRAWGISPASDQQLGGLIMWVPLNIAYIVVVSVLFIRWMQQQDAQQRLMEAQMDEEEEVEEEVEEAEVEEGNVEIG
ncbi:MAG TPA: cytochrome c oxidase assembly protein, partial [Ktedonobacteraceae bacterium]|nr:cytochrome c oxidase assembly protein [Ktedonobacteraceae bacterium]